jgi:peptidoglycan/xylan/chitin deacetylase (PgdA/CDA1 family)
MAGTTEGRKVMDLIEAHPELFEIGSHTMHHCNLAAGGGGSPTTAPCPTSPPSSSFIRQELTDADAVFRVTAGTDGVPFWRPPYGAYNGTVLDAAASVGYTKTFLWDVDTIDWRPISGGGPTAESMARKVVDNAVGGSDVLMHLGGFETLDALPAMIDGLRGRGFQLTTLSDMLEH